jgi:pimeloyl-ACP methyl ester carboxylesterase
MTSGVGREPELDDEDLAVDAAASGFTLPFGRRVELPGRGTTFVREVAGPPGAPTVVLLHGWIASGGVNWFQAFDALGERYRVLAPDLRGHGRGVRSRGRFTLARCADDVAALLEVEATGPVIVVGYSLGGPVAQLLWKRHPHLVSGLVLCATSHFLLPGTRAQMIFTTMMTAAVAGTRAGQLLATVPFRRPAAGSAGRDVPVRPETRLRWLRAEMARGDARQIVEAGLALSNYRARWVGDIDVPTTVLVTANDRAVRPASQLRMALRIPGATIHRVDDGHLLFAKEGFGAVLRAAVDDAATRAADAAA